MTINPTTEPALLLSPRQAAAMLGISPRTLWGLTAADEIPHVRIGRRVLYSRESLAAWIARRERGGE